MPNAFPNPSKIAPGQLSIHHNRAITSWKRETITPVASINIIR